jgi:hypothetical protein
MAVPKAGATKADLFGGLLSNVAEGVAGMALRDIPFQHAS